MNMWFRRLKKLRRPSLFAFCNVLHMGVSGPSLLIESTDSMIVGRCSICGL